MKLKLEAEIDFNFLGGVLQRTCRYDETSRLLTIENLGEDHARAMLEALSSVEIIEVKMEGSGKSHVGRGVRMLSATHVQAAQPGPVPVRPVNAPVAASKPAPATTTSAKPSPAPAAGADATAGVAARLATKPAPAPGKGAKKANLVDEASEPPPAEEPAAEEPAAEEPAADPSGLPPEVLNARKLREILVYYQDKGITDVTELKRLCAEAKPHVTVLKRIDNLDERIDRTLEVMVDNGMG